MAAILGPKITNVTSLLLSLDSTNSTSYPGSGTTWTDLSGNNYNGTLTNGPTFSFVDNSILFDGTNDHVVLPDFDLGTQFTFSCWIKTTSTGFGQLIARGNTADNRGVYLAINNSVGLLTAGGNSGTGWTVGNLSNTVINDGNWHYVVGVYNQTANSCVGYVDGVLGSTITITFDSNSYTPKNTKIGKNQNNAGAQYYSGNIAFVQIYNRALTASDVLDIYNNTKIAFSNIFASKIISTGLILSLDAGNTNSYPGSGTTWTDLTGNGRTGTLTNGPTFNSGNGGSIVFDGSNDYVDITNTASTFAFANSTFTVNIWFKQSALSNGALISKSGAAAGWSIWAVSDGTIVSYMKNGSSVDNYDRFTSAVITANTWINIVAIFTTSTSVAANNSVTHYVNGVVNTGTIIVGSGAYGNETSTNLQLGRRSTSPWFTGNIAIAQIYNRGLTATEVLQNYNSVKSRFGL